VSAITPVANSSHLSRGRIWLSVNGEPKQEADLSDMIWSVPEIIARLSRQVRLAAGDIIMTGTPAGVGPLSPGDKMEAGIDGIGELRIGIAPAG
jgi:fumarylpyruvate hydrolase